MKNLARVRWALAMVAAVSAGGAATVVGCSDDGTTVNPLDGGATDGSSKLDSSSDGEPGDAGGDAINDQGSPDVETPVLLSYHTQITKLLCEKIASCCGAQSFDLAKCRATFLANRAPGVGLTGAVSERLDGGHIQLDMAKARQCFVDIANLGCGAVSADTYIKLHDDCLSGAVGDIPQGGTGCHGSGECTRPNHCDIAADASTGTCNPPRALNAECSLGSWVLDGGNYEFINTERFYEPQAQCGFLITGVPRYCANQDTNYGSANGTNTCREQVGTGGPCYYNYECKSYMCDNLPDDGGPGGCVTSAVLASQGTCNFYKTDGGTTDAAQ